MPLTSHDLHRLVCRSTVLIVAALFLVLPNLSCTRAPRYSDESFYEDIAWGIMTGLVDIYNQNIAGTPAGPVDIVANGPFGGTVHITGTTSYDSGNGIETVHLEYDLTNCRVSSTSSSSSLNVDLTLNGIVSEDGTWSSSYVSLSYSSANLGVAGSSERGTKMRDVSGATPFKANRTSSGTSAELFGLKVSW
ncbi:hypothetical protein FJY68_02170 [candidate division WOR-3 bacterium]|uniref:Uncharacterized protein n=1 Tax=candidate division WOR-3 bacterium TaxID=2052148 RepID=A0A938BSK0_UNCW3|nr:hypothetical protein [candidate division WOR-3 bacterium]